MKIIKKGKVPYYKYILKCRACKTVYEVEEELKKYVYHCEFKRIITYSRCPICDSAVYKDIFSKKIKYY